MTQMTTTQWTDAERYMMEQVRGGSDEAWSQLVERYQGRLIAFARIRTPRSMEAEDLVQDTFLLFLRGLKQFKEQASIETFLFTILRHRLAEVHRGKKIKVCEITQPGENGDQLYNLPTQDSTPSTYLRRNEQHGAAQAALGAALHVLIHRMKSQADLQNLQILEMVFYGQHSNQQIAAKLNIQASRIALLKHRWIKQLHQTVGQSTVASGLPWDTNDAIDSLLTETWEDLRPSCPKRSTLGGYVLGTLDESWQNYVDFHVNQLGCSFCRASRDDLMQQSRQNLGSLRHRILQSTVGFLR